MESLIYLIRHGAIDKPSPRSFFGQTDLPLSDTGIRQAQYHHEHLKNIPFTKIIRLLDMLRCVSILYCR